MTPRYGRAYGQERAYLSSPFKRSKNMTIIGAIDHEKVMGALYGEWAANGEIFLQFLKESLCPNLESRHVVVMDNVGFHQVNGVKEMIESTGASLMYLPPYHPEFNPIENMWSKIKNSLRTYSARTSSTFKKAIKAAFESVRPEDLTGWFKHAGYVDQF